MSLRAILWALNDAPVDDAQRVLVLIGLADNAREDGTATWPSVATLAERARCSPRTVQRHLSALKADGLIREGDQTLVRQYRKDRRPVVYDLNLDAARGDTVTPREDEDPSTRGDTDAPRGDSGAPRGDSDDIPQDHGVTPVTERGDTGVTQTVLDPSSQARTSGKPDDPPRYDVEKICASMVDAVVRNGVKRPTVTDTWRTDARLMLDRDKRPLAEVLSLIAWASDDSFWRTNVLSVPTLRKQYDKLRLQRDREQGRSAPDDHELPWTARLGLGAS